MPAFSSIFHFLLALTRLTVSCPLLLWTSLFFGQGWHIFPFLSKFILLHCDMKKKRMWRFPPSPTLLFTSSWGQLNPSSWPPSPVKTASICHHHHLSAFTPSQSREAKSRAFFLPTSSAVCQHEVHNSRHEARGPVITAHPPIDWVGQLEL